MAYTVSLLYDIPEMVNIENVLIAHSRKEVLSPFSEIRGFVTRYGCSVFGIQG